VNVLPFSRRRFGRWSHRTIINTGSPQVRDVPPGHFRDLERTVFHWPGRRQRWNLLLPCAKAEGGTGSAGGMDRVMSVE